MALQAVIVFPRLKYNFSLDLKIHQGFKSESKTMVKNKGNHCKKEKPTKFRPRYNKFLTRVRDK